MVAKKHKADIDKEIEGNVVESEEKDKTAVDIKVVEAKKEAEQYKNLYLRALADYKNLEHRVAQERQQMRVAIKKDIVFSLLPILDNLAQAEVFNQDPGLKMISSSFTKALEEMGVKEVELLGTEFDPQLAEVVEVQPGKEDDIIIDIVQKAYELNGQIIRPGKVRVSKKAS